MVSVCAKICTLDETSAISLPIPIKSASPGHMFLFQKKDPTIKGFVYLKILQAIIYFVMF